MEQIALKGVLALSELLFFMYASLACGWPRIDRYPKIATIYLAASERVELN